MPRQIVGAFLFCTLHNLRRHSRVGGNHEVLSVANRNALKIQRFKIPN